MPVNRRKFLVSTGGGLLGAAMLGGLREGLFAAETGGLAPCGPGSKYAPKLKAAFVRRKEEYGMLWPGQIYDGQAAFENYSRQLRAAAEKLGLELELRPEPIYSDAEAEAWIAGAQAAKPDGLVLVLLDRQQHAWPTAIKAADSGLPTVIFSPIGTSFTTNTIELARREGVFLAATNEFSQVESGMKMLKAGAKLREMRFIVIQGERRREERLEHFGTRLRWLPADTFLEEYQRTAENDEIRAIADSYIRHSTKIFEPSRQDVLNGVKSFVVARTLLQREQGDGITMDCLGALSRSGTSLPCISWSRMNDCGIPAACEADLGACVTHALVQLLFDRPGFQQDPVADTFHDCLIGSHCCSPTRLSGFELSPEPFSLHNHHGQRDATVVPVWKVGQRVTVADLLLPGDEGAAAPELLISTGTVLDNIAVPPAGGCVVAVMVKLDGVDDMTELLANPGFHQLFFYGDYKKELAAYCRLFRIKARVI